ncbi:MAG: superoxide dismutase family protein [Alphaproteobacteria bacterium]|nr:superoxide dismutase family protein [Alphaproteobacteria bacterium]
MRQRTGFATLLIATLFFAAPAFAADEASTALKDPDGKEVGQVTVTEVPTGVLLTVDLKDYPAGDHALHIHAVGKCEGPKFESAGPHFNPENKEHGLKNPKGPHAGDMPNIHVPKNGKLKIEVLNQMVSLTGTNALLDDDGSAIVIHEGADDYVSDPAGHAGNRLACAAITK